MRNFRTIFSGSPNAAYELYAAVALLDGVIEVSPQAEVEVAGRDGTIDLAVMEGWDSLDSALRTHAVAQAPSEYVLQLGSIRYCFYNFTKASELPEPASRRNP